MASALSSLGLGSKGALSYKTIDKLRAVDNKVIILPIDRKITANKTQTNDLSVLTTLTASLKAETSTLSNEMSYLQRSATSSDTGVSVSVKAGTEIQDFSFNVTTLAKRNIKESQAFAKNTDTFASANDTINFNINGKNYTVDVLATDSIKTFKDKIFGATNGKITASLLNVGGTNPYKLVLKSTDTGASNAITVTSAGITSGTTVLGLTNIQPAGDLSATFNGVQITRATNIISDLVVGTTITANSVANSNVSITQDTSAISGSISSFVTKYNDLMNNLVQSTKYDTQTKTAGTFQGSSDVKNLKSDISRYLLNVDSSGRSLSDYGVSLNSAGTLEFNKSAFDSKMQSSSSDVENFFRGNNTTNGFFTNYNTMLSNYINTSTGVLTRFDTQLTNEKTTLNKNKVTATARLDNKYAIMVKKFSAYDAIIGQMNASFQSLSMQINSITNGTKG